MDRISLTFPQVYSHKLCVYILDKYAIIKKTDINILQVVQLKMIVSVETLTFKMTLVKI